MLPLHNYLLKQPRKLYSISLLVHDQYISTWDNVRDEIITKKQYGVDGDNRMNVSSPLPLPFSARPALGVRLYVRGNTKRFIRAILRELTNWVDKVRLKSAQVKWGVITIQMSLIVISFSHILIDQFLF